MRFLLLFAFFSAVTGRAEQADPPAPCKDEKGWEKAKENVAASYPVAKADTEGHLKQCGLEQVPDTSRKSYENYVAEFRHQYCDQKQVTEGRVDEIVDQAVKTAEGQCEPVKAVLGNLINAKKELEALDHFLKSHLDESNKQLENIRQKITGVVAQSTKRCSEYSLQDNLPVCREFKKSMAGKRNKAYENSACVLQIKTVQTTVRKFYAEQNQFWGKESTLRERLAALQMEHKLNESRIAKMKSMEQKLQAIAQTSCTTTGALAATGIVVAPATADGAPVTGAGGDTYNPHEAFRRSGTATLGEGEKDASLKNAVPAAGDTAGGMATERTGATATPAVKDSSEPAAAMLTPAAAEPAATASEMKKYQIYDASEMSSCYSSQCKREDIIAQQEAINRYIDEHKLPVAKIKVDGIAGTQTANAWRAVERDSTQLGYSTDYSPRFTNDAVNTYQQWDPDTMIDPKTGYVIFKKGKGSSFFTTSDGI